MKLFLISLFLFLGFLVYFYTHGQSKNSTLKINLSKEDIETLDSKNNSDQSSSHKILAKPISLIQTHSNVEQNQNRNANENINDRFLSEYNNANDNDNLGQDNNEDEYNNEYDSSRSYSNPADLDYSADSDYSGNYDEMNAENDPSINPTYPAPSRAPASDQSYQNEYYNRDELTEGEDNNENN